MINFNMPKGFLWGTGSSAFQVEGAFDTDGKGMNVWDYDSSVNPDKYYNGDRPAVSCDFYHRYREDIAEMAELGLKSFRLSISWSRVLPEGRGRINEKGLDFYDRVFDELSKHDIKPFVDLYHWDLPQTLAEQGGFGRPGIVDDFSAFAELCFRRYGDRVKLWSTVNEPSAEGFFDGYCYNPDVSTKLKVAHHVLLCHFTAVKLHRQWTQDSQIGAVIPFVPVYAKSAGDRDRQAAALQQDYLCNRWLDPMLKGTYPDMLIQHPHVGEHLPDLFIESINDHFVPMDFIGLNYYYPNFIEFNKDGFLNAEAAANYCVQSDYGFTTYPQGLFDSMVYAKDRYGDVPIYLTENGLGIDSTKEGFNPIEDDDRIHYMQEHMREAARAIKAGVDLKGYYYWSNFDSYECDKGYQYKFGLNSIDLQTQERTRTKSWYYYQKCISGNRVY